LIENIIRKPVQVSGISVGDTSDFCLGLLGQLRDAQEEAMGILT
jgi:hypothetical protein